jgi:hypothetical protein
MSEQESTHETTTEVKEAASQSADPELKRILRRISRLLGAIATAGMLIAVASIAEVINYFGADTLIYSVSVVVAALIGIWFGSLGSRV